MEFTVERASTSTFPSGRKCGTFMVRVELELDDIEPSEVAITCAGYALQAAIETWWEVQSGSTAKSA